MLLFVCIMGFPVVAVDLNRIKLISIPETNIRMMEVEVPQSLYKAVMGENPSYFKDDNRPVENVSWYDAIMFCNAFSTKNNYTPVYDVSFSGKGLVITYNSSANGFRLPTVEEWAFAAKGGESYIYAGSDNIDEVAWHGKNSSNHTHWVGQKKPNGYGLYDMSGNVSEWCWDDDSFGWRGVRGGGWDDTLGFCKISKTWSDDAGAKYDTRGFRVVQNIK